MPLSEKQKEVVRQDAITTKRVFAELRRGRLEAAMTGRIRKAWEQLDVATEECIRLSREVQKMRTTGDNEMAASFQQTLQLEQAKAMGKCEILALIMPAPLHTPKAISEEAGRRWQKRSQGIPYETPGIRMVAATVMDDLDPNQNWT